MIKSLDQNHLVSIGSEGLITNCQDGGNDVKTIDYVTVHAWAQNWNWYKPESRDKLAYGIERARTYIDNNLKHNEKRGKPLVLEEFGLGRDKISLDPKSTTYLKDDYYRNIFQYVYDHAAKDGSISGANFWAYAGVGRPNPDRKNWIAGDDFIGDPAHEDQGWYSVYDTDTTMVLIEEFAKEFDKL